MVSQCNGLSCVLSLVDGTALALSGLDLRRCNQSIGLFEKRRRRLQALASQQV